MATRLGQYTPVAGNENSLDREDSFDPFNPEEQILDSTLSSIHTSPRSSLSVSAGNLEIDDTSLTQTKPSLTFFNGLALVIGLQIGSGIFSVPSQVSRHVESAGSGVLMWFVGGILVWTGAASFIELGLAVPKNGGIQEYLRHCYGDFLGFLFAWIWVSIAAPSGMAMQSMIFSEHFTRAVIPTAWSSSILSKLVAILGLAVIVFINCLGARTGALVANGLLVLKLLAVGSIILLGLGYATTGKNAGPSSEHAGWFGLAPTSEGQDSWTLFGNYVTALFGVLFCYGGWDILGFVAGDMKDPVRDLPRVINTAMTIVISSFLLTNVALYMVIPIELMRDNDTPGVDFGLTLFGTVGGLLYSLIISASAIGALNVNVFATARLCVAASRRHYFPSIFGNMHIEPGSSEVDYYEKKLPRAFPSFRNLVKKFAHATADLRLEKGVPIYAILLSGCLAACYICVGSFDGLVTFVGISGYLFFFLAVLGLYKIRKGPSSPASYRTWTANPCIFCAVSALLVLRGIITDPLQGGAIALLVLVGWFVYRRTFTVMDT